MGKICRGVLLTVAYLALVGVAYGQDADYGEFEDTRTPQQSAFALTIGTPAGLNLTFAGGLGPKWGIYTSGMYMSGEEATVGGFQGGVVRVFNARPNHFQCWLLSAGYSYIRNKGDEHRWTFAGIGHIWKWKALYTQVDMMIGSGDYPNPQIGLQVGVVLKTFRVKR